MFYTRQMPITNNTLGAIHKGCPHIDEGGEGGGSGKSGQMRTVGGGWLAKCGRPLGKKNYSYHICQIYSDNLAVYLYVKFSFCLYSIENVWNAM